MGRELFRRGTLLLMLIGTAPAALAVSAEELLDLPLEDALRKFEAEGLHVFYSSDLVRTSMRVETPPKELEPADAVAEILAPHGLRLRRGLNESWLVVRAPRQAEKPRAAEARSPEPATEPAAAPPIEELIVAASQYEISRARTSTQQIIGERDLEYMPDIGDDVIRAVARLPGIASNGFSALSHFRGGEPGETLIRLDGLRLYDPFHLRDFQAVFSAIDPRIVSSMSIYTGGFPAVFGDRMSGVVDVQTMAVEKDIYHEIGASFFNRSVLSSGRFADDRGEWIASARRSNLDVLYRNFSQLPDRPKYSDVFAKIRYELNDKLAITGNVLRAEDDIELADDEDREENATAHQLDSYAWLKLDHSPGPLTSGSTLLARTSLDASRAGESDKFGISNGTLTDTRSFSITTLQSDWSRLLGTRMLLEFGGGITRQRGRYDYADDVEFDLLFDLPGAQTATSRSRSISIQPHGRQYAFYTTLRMDWNPRLATEFGLRWNQQSFDAAGQTTREPRIGLRYVLSEHSTLRASWGSFYQTQTINELQVSDGVTQFFPPQRSKQIVIGYDRLFPNGIILRLEAYDKGMSDLRPRFENLLNARVILPELKPDRLRIAPENAQARGLELTLEGKAGRYEWWGSLSWARVEDRIAGVDVPRSWDQTYALNAGFQWNAGAWIVSSAIVYRAGWPTSYAALDSEAGFPTVIVPSRNDRRLSAFGSLDLRVSREFELERSALSLFFELANVTDRTNPCCLEYEIGDDEEAGQFTLTEQSYLPTIPSVGFLWKF